MFGTKMKSPAVSAVGSGYEASIFWTFFVFRLKAWCEI